jgi:DNA polymerase I-like protein with 3'-5' exonuclease and polymerase domains
MIEGHEVYDVVNQVPMSRYDGVKSSKLYLVHTIHEWKAFYELLMQQKLVACDTETEGFHWFNGQRIVGMSFGWNDMHFYVPVRHQDSCLAGVQPAQIDMDDIRKDLQKFFAQTDVFTIWHNCKFDAHFYRADNIEILTPFHDTRILWQLYDENAPGALKTIASGWKDQVMGIQHEGLVGPEAKDQEQELSKWRGREATARRMTYRRLVQTRAEELGKAVEHQDKNKTELKKWVVENELHNHKWKNASKEDVHYGFVPIQLMTKYAATDTVLTWEVYVYVMKNLQFGEKLRKLYANEIKLSRALMEAEDAGVKVDRRYMEQLKLDLGEEITELTAKILKVLGPINLNSPGQLGTALVNAGAEITKKTQGGNYSTTAAVLKKLAGTTPIIKDVLELRKLKKLRDTYVIGILNKLTPEDILHCSFNQNVTTGRMSSRDPNLQNIPGRDDRIRRAFISPGADYIYVFADYSQVEVRLTAHYSSDPVLLDAYAKNQDIHTRTACEMFGMDYDNAIKILKDNGHPEFKYVELLRNISKRINFGIIYGVGAPGLSEQIPRPDQHAKLEEEEWVKVCQDYIDSYLRRYLGVKRFIHATNRAVRKNAIVYNYFGRPRRLPHAKADKILGRDKYWLVGRAQRQGLNFLVQGTAADLFKIAIVRVFDLFQREAKKSRIVNFVHDEIQAYIHKDELFLLNKMRDLMEDFDFIVPVPVDFSWSNTCWADYRKLG